MKVKYYELDQEEKELLDAYERGEFVSTIKSKQELKKYQRYATNTLRKNRNINIRLNERDVLKLKAKAIEEGLPYQTLIGSILHKAANAG